MASVLLVAMLLATLVALAPAGPVAARAPEAAPPVATKAAACDLIRLGGRVYIFYRVRVSCKFAKRWARRLYR